MAPLVDDSIYTSRLLLQNLSLSSQPYFRLFILRLTLVVVYEVMGSIAVTADKALSHAIQRYIERNRKSKILHDEAVKYLPGGNSRSVLHTAPFPISMASGQSCYLVDDDGHQ
jgi:hypothetical protein